MSLPAEVLAHVFRSQQLTNRDFLALRATCKKARNMAPYVVEGMHAARAHVGGVPSPRICRGEGRFAPVDVLAFATHHLLAWRVDFRDERERAYVEGLPSKIKARLALRTLCRSPHAAVASGPERCTCEMGVGERGQQRPRGDRRGNAGDVAAAAADVAEGSDYAQLVDGVHTLDLAWCGKVGPRPLALSNVQLVDLSFTNVEDVTPLRHVRQVELRKCARLKSVEGFAGGSVVSLNLGGCVELEDVSPLSAGRLPSLRTLNITSTHVTSLEGLGHLQVLYAGDLAITDVSPVAGVADLYLGSCPELVEVGCLKDVKRLSLACCRRVMDVTALGSLHSLDLSGTGITNVDGLGRVRRLRLQICRQLNSVAGLGAGNQRVDLSWNEQLTDLSPLQGVPVVICTGLRQLTDIQPLAEAVMLDLRGCTRLHDVTPLMASETLRDVILENTAVKHHMRAALAERCRVHTSLCCLP
jgi:Leucine-rich repeat (LRR) protein